MLLSGNGRHRRPRPTPKLIVAAGVTGAGVAIPLMGANVATAADGTTWDKVALCESGGSWSINTGNGYYGGLQISENTWKQYGGKSYAPRPDLSSRLEQIAIGEKIFADQGPEAWPTCSVEAGLAEGVTAAETETTGARYADEDTRTGDESSDKADSGTTTSPSDDSSDDTAAGDGTGGSASDREDSGTAASGDDTPSSSGSGSDGTTTKAPKHAAPPTGDEEERTSRSGTGKHRAPVTKEEAEAGIGQETAADAPAGEQETETGETAADDTAEAPAEDEYTVVTGDNLTEIAEQVGLDGWTSLYDANKDTVGEDPDLILPGQELQIG